MLDFIMRKIGTVVVLRYNESVGVEPQLFHDGVYLRAHRGLDLAPPTQHPDVIWNTLSSALTIGHLDRPHKPVVAITQKETMLLSNPDSI